MAPLAAGVARWWPRLTGTITLFSFQARRQRRSRPTTGSVAVTVGLLLALAACGSGEGSTAETLEQVAATVAGESADAVDPDDDAENDAVVIEASDDDGATGDLNSDDIATSAVADEAADRSLVPPRKGVTTRSADAVGDGSPPQDVGTAIIRITDADGNVCEVCMWHADEADERSTGLMGVLDLDVPIGMAFAWDAPTSGNFFMFNTPTPLSIAWFAPDGSYLSEADMAPCDTDDSSTCERYGTTGEYTLAIEMFQGELGKVGIGPGSRAEVVKLPEAGREHICPLLD